MKKNVLTLMLVSAMLSLPAMANNQSNTSTCLDSIENVKSCLAQIHTEKCLSNEFIIKVFENLNCGNISTGWQDILDTFLPDALPPSPPQTDSDPDTEVVPPEQTPEQPPEFEPEVKPEVKPEQKPEEMPEQKPETTPDTDNESSEQSFLNEVIRLVNVERQKSGLSAVSMDNSLNSAALVRAKEIVSLFSHTRPNGQSCFSVLSDMGISYNGAGENIAMGQTSPSQVMSEWMNSQGHRENILNPSFKNLGVGVYKVGSRYYWAQMFTY